jgi:tetratricopeptide (TPR) repeat protein
MQLVEQLEAQGEDQDRGFAQLCGHVAAVALSFGDHGRALPYYEKCLPIYQRTDGAESANVEGIYSQMGLVYQEIGRHEAALENHQQSLAICLARLGSSTRRQH